MTLNSNFTLCLFSPLDQFGADSVGNDLIGILLCDFLDTIDFLGAADLFSFSFIQSVFSSFISTSWVEDDDCADSEWSDNDTYLSNIQSSILVSNLMGMFPGLETSTSDAALTFYYSFSTMICLSLFGFSLHGLRYFAVFLPAGTPIGMAPFIILIEVVSYLARAISLGMRLFANMFAGHSLVKIIMSFAWLFSTSVFPVLSVPVFILLLVIFLMEVGIAYLQSYVFGALTAMYFEDAINMGH